MKRIIQRIVLWLIRGFVKTLCKLFFQLQVDGRENIPQEGGALIVANHVSYIDFMLILCTVPRHVSFVMNADVFRKPFLRFLFEAARCVPISSRGGKNNLEEFNQTVSERVNNGELVVIFAEGTVTRTGQLLEFKKGVEHISRLIHAPIIPIHFFNATGAPFSFKAGQSRMQKITLTGWRRPVWARIGKTVAAPTTAFALRQNIKALEVENIQTYLEQSPDLPELLIQAINKNKTGAWHVNQDQLAFSGLRNKLRSLDLTLGPVINDSRCVAIMAPKSVETLAIMCWLLIRRITIVPIPAHLNNEEQLFAFNRSKAEWMITTRDLDFTGCAPIAEQIIYIEDLKKAANEGRPVPAIQRQARHIGQSMLSLLRAKPERNELAFVLFDKKDTCVAISYKNVWATLLGLRQVYFFKKGTVQLSDIPHTNANGLVMELLVPLLHDMELHVARTQGTEDDFIAQLIQCEPSLVMATPLQLQHLSELAERQNLPYLTHIFTAGILPQNTAIQALRQRNIEVYVCAGLNQTSSVYAINLNDYSGIDVVGKPMEQENQNSDSIGKALPGVAVRVIDNHGQECRTNVQGQLWIKGPSVAIMHHTQSDCQQKLVNGWLNANCIASIDHQGFIFLHEANEVPKTQS